MRSQKTFFTFQRFEYNKSVENDENPHTQNFTGIGSLGPKIWLHEYLISPIEISVNWPGS